MSTFDVHMYPNARRQLQLCRKTEREWCEKVRDRRHTSIGREEGRNKKFSLLNSVFIVAINSINCLDASRFWNTICKVPCRRTGNFERPLCRGFAGCWADSENVLRAALSQTWPLLKSQLELLFHCLDQDIKSEKILWPSSSCRPRDSPQLHQNIRIVSYRPFLALSLSFVRSSIFVYLHFSSDKSKWHFKFYSTIYCHLGFNLWKNNWKERGI